MKRRKQRPEINLASILLGALLGVPLGTILATERINIVSVCMLVFGLLVLFSQLLMQFKDKDRLKELDDMNEGLES